MDVTQVVRQWAFARHTEYLSLACGSAGAASSSSTWYEARHFFGEERHRSIRMCAPRIRTNETQWVDVVFRFSCWIASGCIQHNHISLIHMLAWPSGATLNVAVWVQFNVRSVHTCGRTLCFKANVRSATQPRYVLRHMQYAFGVRLCCVVQHQRCHCTRHTLALVTSTVLYTCQYANLELVSVLLLYQNRN